MDCAAGNWGQTGRLKQVEIKITIRIKIRIEFGTPTELIWGPSSGRYIYKGRDKRNQITIIAI